MPKYCYDNDKTIFNKVKNGESVGFKTQFRIRELEVKVGRLDSPFIQRVKTLIETNKQRLG